MPAGIRHVDYTEVVFLSKRTCAHVDLKGNKKYHTFPTVKSASPLAISVHYEQLCRAPTSASDGTFL